MTETTAFPPHVQTYFSHSKSDPAFSLKYMPDSAEFGHASSPESLQSSPVFPTYNLQPCMKECGEPDKTSTADRMHDSEMINVDQGEITTGSDYRNSDRVSMSTVSSLSIDDLEEDFCEDFDNSSRYEIDNSVEKDDLETDGYDDIEETTPKSAFDDTEVIRKPEAEINPFSVKERDLYHLVHTVTPVTKISVKHGDLDSPEYDTTHPYRGRCLVISNTEFHDSDHPRRTGSLRDARTIQRQINDLGFRPIRCTNGTEEMIHQNVTRKELLDLMKQATDPTLNDYTDYDCFMCVILSYGLEGAVMCADETDDNFLETDCITEHFKPQHCPSLAYKPKMFFIQGCKPYQTYSEMAISPQLSDTLQIPAVFTMKSSVPSQSDILVQFCGVDGSLGWGRNRRRGLSYYVEALCKSLKKFCVEKIEKHEKSVEISSLVLRINQMFLQILEDDDISPDEDFCVPLTKSTFTKSLYFYRKPSQDLENG